MSLINQMLRDLERRQAVSSEPVPNARQYWAVKREQSKHRSLWLFLFTALACAYLLRLKQIEPLLPPKAGNTDAKYIRDSQPQDSIGKQLRLNLLPISPANAVMPDSLRQTLQTIPDPGALPKQIIQEENHAPVVLQAMAEIETDKDIPKTKHHRKILSIREQVSRLYRQAQKGRSQADTEEALREALDLDPLFLPARTLLLETMLASQAPADAIDYFTETSLQLFPDNLQFIKTRAHLLIQQKKFADAINLLERVDAGSSEDSAYLSLLALSYEQSQRYMQAADVYQRLVLLQPDKAENWLGLGIVQEKLSQNQSAAQAYRQALNKNTLNNEVVDYINQRLSALN
jgi:MSHA biogenesis protein MshN